MRRKTVFEEIQKQIEDAAKTISSSAWFTEPCRVSFFSRGKQTMFVFSNHV